MAKANHKVKLESTGGTGYYKTTHKNSKNDPEKLQLMKYDPILRRHVIFKEKKIK